MKKEEEEEAGSESAYFSILGELGTLKIPKH